jgi:small GTP-binding protein
MSEDVKLVVLGNSGVGKTSMIIRFITDNYKVDIDSTIGASYMTKIVNLGSSYLKINIWDTAGQERFRSIVHMYYKDIGVAILVYDLTNSDSFSRLSWWYSEMRQHIDYNLTVVVVANKEDLVLQEKVPLEEAKEFADSIGAMYFRTSAKTNAGITEMFMQIAQQVTEIRRNSAQTSVKRSISLRNDHSKERVERMARSHSGCCS